MNIDDPRDARSDEFLVRAMNRGDSAAFEALYYRYRDWVTTMARRFTGHDDDSLDVLQETFAYFLRKFPGFRLRAKLTTFLYPVIKHLAIAAAKKRRRHAGGGEGITEAMAPEDDAPDADRLEDSRAELEYVLRHLGEGPREVLLLRFIDDLSLEEIGALLDVPIGTVKSRVHNALKTLRNDPRTQRYFENF